MAKKLHLRNSDRVFTATVVVIFLVALVFILIAIPINSETYLYAANSPVHVLSENWTITDSSGNVSDFSFPTNIEYGRDGIYSLKTILPNDPTLRDGSVIMFYSNYVDVSVYLENEPIYSYPFSNEIYTKATGNTWHYVHMDDFADKEITIRIRCQLGDDIPYLIEAPQLGSKTTMLNTTVKNSIFSFALVCCMVAVSLITFVMHFILKRLLDLDTSALYLSFFAISFALYVFFEMPYTKLMIPNSYVTYTCTYIALAILPIPLVGMFTNSIPTKQRNIGYSLMILCALNLVCQSIFHFTNTVNFRVMLAYTHAVIILVIITMIAVYVYLAKTGSKAISKTRFFATIPMITGGIIDITLIWAQKPSFNNSFWFLIGVTLFILVLFVEFLVSYFTLHKKLVESEILRRMAYHDELSGLGNRNAFENHIKSLDRRNDLSTVGCIVVDINGLKRINDTFGHAEGDKTIARTGRIILQQLSAQCKAYRTGGDEFVMIFDTLGLTDALLTSSVELLVKSIADNDETTAYSIAYGYGCFSNEDTNIHSFISRIDTLMYAGKETVT